MTDSDASPDGGWCERFGESLAAASGQHTPLITPAMRASLLTIARDIAHGTERRNAPLCAFIAGRYVEARGAQGIDTDTALTEVAEAAAQLLRDATP